MGKASQYNFSSLLFDTLFGLVLFFNLDFFLEMKNPWHFGFYLISFFILIHWWLLFRAADDTFGAEVENSLVDLLFGLGDLILITYVILLSRNFEYQQATYFLIALFALDLSWALIWRLVGKWSTPDQSKIQAMERELNYTIIFDIISIILLIGLIISAPWLVAAWYVYLFAAIYIIFTFLTFQFKIIDLRSF